MVSPVLTKIGSRTSTSADRFGHSFESKWELCLAEACLRKSTPHRLVPEPKAVEIKEESAIDSE